MAVYQSVLLLEGYMASATWASPTLEGPHLLVLHVREITVMYLLALVRCFTYVGIQGDGV